LKNPRSVILRKRSDRRISIISSKSEILRCAQDDKLSTIHFSTASKAGIQSLIYIVSIVPRTKRRSLCVLLFCFFSPPGPKVSTPGRPGHPGFPISVENDSRRPRPLLVLLRTRFVNGSYLKTPQCAFCFVIARSGVATVLKCATRQSRLFLLLYSVFKLQLLLRYSSLLNTRHSRIFPARHSCPPTLVIPACRKQESSPLRIFSSRRGLFCLRLFFLRGVARCAAHAVLHYTTSFRSERKQ